MARNPLTSVKGLSAGAPSLDSLDASETPLVNLADLPERLPRLTELQVRGCAQLTSLAALTPVRCPALSYLDASGVQLSPEALIANCTDLAELDALAEVHLSCGPGLDSAQRSIVETPADTAITETDMRLRRLLPQVPRINGVDIASQAESYDVSVCHSPQLEASRQRERLVGAELETSSCRSGSGRDVAEAHHHRSSIDQCTKPRDNTMGAKGAAINDEAMQAFMKLHNIHAAAVSANCAPTKAALIDFGLASAADEPRDTTNMVLAAQVHIVPSSPALAQKVSATAKATAAGARLDVFLARADLPGVLLARSHAAVVWCLPELDL